jgi:hypothetical protein
MGRARGVNLNTCNERYVGKEVPDHLAYPMILKRLLAKSRRTENGCLEWTGWRNYEGYGQTSFRSHNEPTHRLMYLAIKGPVPDDKIIRHKCDNPPCMEPDHLLLGTEAQNTADSLERGRHYRASKTHCRRGHDLAEHALITHEGFRSCRPCSRIRQRMMAGWSEYDAINEPVCEVGQRPAHIIIGIPYKGRPKESSHCTKGHELTDENRYVSPRGFVECQTCRSEARARFVARKRALTSNNPGTAK